MAVREEVEGRTGTCTAVVRFISSEEEEGEEKMKGKKVKSMGEESLTCLREREVLKFRDRFVSWVEGLVVRRVVLEDAEWVDETLGLVCEVERKGEA